MNKRNNFVPQTDLSEYFRTEKLMESWYMLSNKNISILVDTIKPRILRVFAHGKFGTLQQLTYDTNGFEQDVGMWGIVPTYFVGEERFYPFIHQAKSFDDNSPDKILFDNKKNQINLEGITTYNKNRESGGKLDMEILLKGNKIIISVEYPKEAESTELTSGWYPLYTEYKREKDREWKPVEYFRDGFLSYNSVFNKDVGKRLVLTDWYGRVPILKIGCEKGSCRLVSGTDKERGNAFYLRALVKSRGRRNTVTMELIPNSINLKLNPIVPTGRNRIEISTQEIQNALVNGTKVPIKKKEKGKYEIVVDVKKGKNELTVAYNERKCLRKFYGIENPVLSFLKMAEVVSILPWKESPLKNIIPYFYYLDRLEPAYRAGYSFCAHSLRVFPLLATASLISNNRKYVKRAMECVEAVIDKSHHFSNGDLLVPLSLDKNGNPGYVSGTRPSDNGIMIRALLYNYYVFKHLGDKKKAKRCIDFAIRYAHTYERMQEADGGFYPRYHYPDLKPNIGATEPKGTVNNWAVQLWELSCIYEDIDKKEMERLRNICLKHIDFLLFKFKPGLLKIAGGGEDMPNFFDALSTASTYLAMKYLTTGDKKFKKYAEDAFKMAAYTVSHYIDQPQNFFYAACYHGGCFYNQPEGLLTKGGMHDLTLIEAGLFLKKYLDFDFGELVSRYSSADVLVDSLKDNGSLYGFITTVPNYYYLREDAAEPLNFGGVGIYGYYYIKSGGTAK